MHVVFVAPYLMRATLQFVDGASRVPGADLTLITCDPQAKVPPGVASRLNGFYQMSNDLSANNIELAVRKVSEQMGPVSRLLGTLENIQVPLAEVRERLQIPGVDAATALNFRDKSRMKEVLRAKGVPCARHCLTRDLDTGLAFADQVGFPLIAKPPDGAGSRNTYKIDFQADLISLFEKQPPTTQRPILLEEFMMGDELTFDSVRVGGKMLWHSIIRYFPAPLEVLRNPWIQWAILLPREIDHPFFDDIRVVANQALDALGLESGLSHLEWFRRTNGSIAISEVGARPPGGQITSMHGYAHDFDIHTAWADLMIHGRFPQLERKFAAGTVFLRGQGQGRVKAVHGLDRVQRELGDMIVEAKLPQAGQPTSGTYEGEGYLILKHPITGIVEKAIDLILNQVRVEVG